MANKMLIDASHPEETRVVVVRGRVTVHRTWSAATLRAMDSSQVRAEERPAKLGSDRRARR